MLCAQDMHSPSLSLSLGGAKAGDQRRRQGSCELLRNVRFPSRSPEAARLSIRVAEIHLYRAASVSNASFSCARFPLPRPPSPIRNSPAVL